MIADENYIYAVMDAFEIRGIYLSFPFDCMLRISAKIVPDNSYNINIKNMFQYELMSKIKNKIRFWL